jgi:hypothetical protein
MGKLHCGYYICIIIKQLLGEDQHMFLLHMLLLHMLFKAY